jgi:hypothetical protein
MVSVMLLTVSLTTLGLLAVRSSVHEVTEAGQLVARERALMVAQAAVDLAATQYIELEDDTFDEVLTGYNGGPSPAACTDPCRDCIPDASAVITGQRNEVLAGSAIACSGRPCMRQGAVVVLNDALGAPGNWCDVPFASLVNGGDAEARVSVWVRNNAADALGAKGSGLWVEDRDRRVVVTATATVRNTTVTVEQEIILSDGNADGALKPQTADEGYGGGHNNDNSAVSVCVEDYQRVTGS